MTFAFVFTAAITSANRMNLLASFHLAPLLRQTSMSVPSFATIEKGREPWALGTGALVIGGGVILILGVVIALAILGMRDDTTPQPRANQRVALNVTPTPRLSTPTPAPSQPALAVTPQPSVETPTPLPTRETIVDSTFPVRARSYQSYSFNVTGSGHLTGTFNATGGRDDIDVWVIDAKQMLNFANGHNTFFYYHSDYVSYGEVNLRLRPGAYYIVFSNRTALLTNKIVDAHIYLEES